MANTEDEGPGRPPWHIHPGTAKPVSEILGSFACLKLEASSELEKWALKGEGRDGCEARHSAQHPSSVNKTDAGWQTPDLGVRVGT